MFSHYWLSQWWQTFLLVCSTLTKFHGPPHSPDINSFVLRLHRLRTYTLTKRRCSSEQLYTESHSIYHSNISRTKYWLDKQDILQSCRKSGDPWNNLMALQGSKTCRLQTTRLRYPKLAVLFVQSCYGLHGPEIESQWRQDFPGSPDWPQGPPSLQYDGYRVFPLGKVVGVWCSSPAPSSARLQMGRRSISTSPLCPQACDPCKQQ